jgi:hypothetical protein
MIFAKPAKLCHALTKTEKIFGLPGRAFATILKRYPESSCETG